MNLRLANIRLTSWFSSLSRQSFKLPAPHISRFTLSGRVAAAS